MSNEAELRTDGGLYRDEKGRTYRGGPAQVGYCDDCGKWRLLREGICMTCRGEVERIE